MWLQMLRLMGEGQTCLLVVEGAGRKSTSGREIFSAATGRKRARLSAPHAKGSGTISLQGATAPAAVTKRSGRRAIAPAAAASSIVPAPGRLAGEEQADDLHHQVGLADQRRMRRDGSASREAASRNSGIASSITFLLRGTSVRFGWEVAVRLICQNEHLAPEAVIGRCRNSRSRCFQQLSKSDTGKAAFGRCTNLTPTPSPA